MVQKTVLITGARGGLGEALTSEFSNNGWLVIATDLEVRILNERDRGERVREMAMDVSSDTSVGAVAGQLLKEAVQLDLIINNAGIDRYFPLSETPVSHFKEVFEVNVFGSYRVNQVFLPLLKKPGGRIIHVSSEAVKINVPFMTYPISKQTLEGYCRTIRQELRFLGIDVTMIRPGAIRTPFLENVKKMKNPVPDSQLNGPFEKFAAQAHKEIGKTVEPAVVAKSIYRIAAGRKTRPVYKINNSMQLSVASILPFCLTEKVVHRRLR
ncbi:MAG: SDR family NAD(P)-dependent oxidoreductase [Bacteroidetes bacterium]|nr:SDR family NAD(P)-dependent oxidoreductase [Bacteroidota bacterium]